MHYPSTIISSLQISNEKWSLAGSRDRFYRDLRDFLSYQRFLSVIWVQHLLFLAQH